MKNRFAYMAIMILIFGAVLCFVGPVYSAEEMKPMGKSLTEAQQKDFESMQMHLEYEHGVCREHCGGQAACLEKCKKAYEGRLEKARQRVTYGNTPPADDIQEAGKCAYCGMDRQKFNFSRMVVEYDDGSSLGACSLHCAAIDIAVHMDRVPRKIWVGDYNSKKLIDAEEAIWVIGGDKPGVMTRRAKWAFGSRAGAEQYIKTHGGEIAMFDGAMSAVYQDMYEDSKMIREKRKKRHE